MIRELYVFVCILEFRKKFRRVVCFRKTLRSILVLIPLKTIKRVEKQKINTFGSMNANGRRRREREFSRANN